LHALEVFERLGAADNVEGTRELLRELDLELFIPVESVLKLQQLIRRITLMPLISG